MPNSGHAEGVAGGRRVVRSESDRGIVLLMDDRYYDPAYVALLPASWQLYDEDIALAAQRLEETACTEEGER